jgi:hypothetical protein
MTVNSKEKETFKLLSQFCLGGYVGCGLQELNHRLENIVHRQFLKATKQYVLCIFTVYLPYVSPCFFIFLHISVYL